MVQINGQESEPGVVKMCVVQDGVLSPTLFDIFVNDNVQSWAKWNYSNVCIFLGRTLQND
jgi:hypothetical protein